MPNTKLPAGTMLEITDIPAKDGEPFIEATDRIYDINREGGWSITPSSRLIRIHPPGALPLVTPEMIEAVRYAIANLDSMGLRNGGTYTRLIAAFAHLLNPPKVETVRERVDEFRAKAELVGQPWSEVMHGFADLVEYIGEKHIELATRLAAIEKGAKS